MTTWQDFELNCTNHLNQLFGDYATFTHLGASDSTVADIKVQTKSQMKFYIEAKHSPAQCGQFVLFPNKSDKKFEYSHQNILPINQFSREIINFMDENFERFENAGTSGVDINFAGCSEIFAGWIIAYYKAKGVKFFITNDFVILPIAEFSEYFNVSAKYRIKRSGSGAVGSSKIGQVKAFLLQNYSLDNVRIQGNKLFVSSQIELHDKRFVLQDIEFMFSKRGDEYEIRKLSNTFNANVIFSIYLKSNKSGISAVDFAQILCE